MFVCESFVVIKFCSSLMDIKLLDVADVFFVCDERVS